MIEKFLTFDFGFVDNSALSLVIGKFFQKTRNTLQAFQFNVTNPSLPHFWPQMESIALIEVESEAGPLM